MSRRRPLATLLASLVLHGGVLVSVLMLVQRESELGALFIDLTEWAEASRGSGGGTAPAPPPAVGRASAGAAAGPRRVREPRPAPPASAPVAAVRPVESAPSPAAASEAPAPQPPQTPARAELPRGDATTTRAPEAASPGPGAGLGPLDQGGGGARTGARGGAPASFGGRGGGAGASPDAGHGFALATNGSGAGGPAAEYGPYLARLRERIQGSLTYPLAARRRGLAGTVNLEIVIRPDGHIGTVAVADSSSHAILDEAALQTVKRLAPEPFPSDVPPRTLRVRLPVVFALE